ncbi:MAG: glycosyltransferase [Candidatus Helarchaeales archaeon]
MRRSTVGRNVREYKRRRKIQERRVSRRKDEFYKTVITDKEKSKEEERRRKIIEEKIVRRISTGPRVKNPASEMKLPPKINLGIQIDGLVWSHGSFACVTKGLARGFHELGATVTLSAWQEKDDGVKIDPIIESMIYKEIPFSVKIRVSHPDSFSALGLDRRIYRIGYGVCETRSIPNKWASEIRNYCDETWVPSTFVKKAFETKVKNVHVVPNGYEPRYFNPHVEPMDLGIKNKFIFLCNAVMQDRKGTSILVNSFLEEFKNDDDVILVLKSYGWGTGEKEWRNNPKLKIIMDPIPDEKMGGLYTAADCFVLPTKAEGFGMPILEAMACGLPVIVTNYSGHLDFCNDDNSFLIKVDHFEPAFGSDGEDWRGVWAVPDSEHLKDLMREAYNSRDMIKQVGMKGYNHVKKKYTWGNIVLEPMIKLMNRHGIHLMDNIVDGT